MPAGIFVTAKDVSIVEGVHIYTAQKYLRLIKTALGKPLDKKISITEYAEYLMVDEQEIKQKLKIA